MGRTTTRPSSSRLWFWSLIALCCAVWISACHPKATSSSGAVTLTIGVALPQIRGVQSGPGVVVSILVAEPAVGIGWNGRPIGHVVDSWEWLPRDNAFRLHLRPGSKFHDGTPLTSQLAAEIIRRNFGSDAVSEVKSVNAEGDGHVLIRTSRPEGFLLSDLSETRFTLPGNPPIGIGPFKYRSNQKPILLEAFDEYYGGRPAIDRIQIVEYQTQRSAWTAMMRGEVNMLYEVSRDAAEFVEAETGLQTRTFVRPYYVAMVFSQRHPILRRKEIRQALNVAINRAQIVELGMRKRGEPSTGPVWPNHWAYTSTQRSFSYNPGIARLQLDSAGFTVGREHEPGHMPSRFRIRCLVVKDDPRFERIALVLQRQLFDIGVDLDLEPVTWNTVGQRLATGEFDAALMEFIGSRSLNWTYLLWHSPQSGQATYLNSGYQAADGALDRLREAVSDDQIRVAVNDVQRVMYDDPPALFIAWLTTSRALSRDFEVPDEGPRDIMGTVREWRLAPSSMNAQR